MMEWVSLFKGTLFLRVINLRDWLRKQNHQPNVNTFIRSHS
jgi:hypothetical protein